MKDEDFMLSADFKKIRYKKQGTSHTLPGAQKTNIF